MADLAEKEDWSYDDIPVSSGIPRSVVVLVLFGVLGCFIMGGSVVAVSWFGHIWPSAHSMRAPLAKP